MTVDVEQLRADLKWAEEKRKAVSKQIYSPSFKDMPKKDRELLACHQMALNALVPILQKRLARTPAGQPQDEKNDQGDHHKPG